jgi:hypothetical protein
MLNDTDLLEELHAGMTERADTIDAPSGLVAGARRIARRRTATRAATAGVPVLAAAGVATVLAVSGGSGHRAALLPAGSGAQASTPQAPLDHAQDTAYIVRQVSAKLDQAGQTEVVEEVSAGGNGNPGSDSTSPSWSYTDPQTGNYYSSSRLISSGGTDIYDQYIVGTPDGNQMRYQSTNLDPVQREYAVQTSVGPVASDNPAADAQQIKSELANARAIQDGTATIDGQPTIKLTLPKTAGYTDTLYVNAQTFEPVESTGEMVINPNDGADGTNTVTEKWLPGTTANVANAKLAQLPPGFTEVSQSQLEKDNPAGR